MPPIPDGFEGTPQRAPIANARLPLGYDTAMAPWDDPDGRAVKIIAPSDLRYEQLKLGSFVQVMLETVFSPASPPTVTTFHVALATAAS